jgi:hypothetical protein
MRDWILVARAKDVI